jgi:hypothetical protein
MSILRILGRLVLALACGEFLFGLWIWLAGHDVTRSAGELWYKLAPGSLNLSQAIVQRYLHPEIWERVAVPLLLMPFWEAVVYLFIVFFVLGSTLVFFARRRRMRPSERS